MLIFKNEKEALVYRSQEQKKVKKRVKGTNRDPAKLNKLVKKFGIDPKQGKLTSPQTLYSGTGGEEEIMISE